MPELVKAAEEEEEEEEEWQQHDNSWSSSDAARDEEGEEEEEARGNGAGRWQWQRVVGFSPVESVGGAIGGLAEARDDEVVECTEMVVPSAPFSFCASVLVAGRFLC